MGKGQFHPFAGQSFFDLLDFSFQLRQPLFHRRRALSYLKN